MGADIYLESLYEATQKAARPVFDAAVKARDAVCDALGRDHKAYQLAQESVEAAYSLMFSRGYFRDNYNSYGLFAQTELSWGRDVVPMLDDKGRLPIAKAKELLAMVQKMEIKLGPKPDHVNSIDGKPYKTESPAETKRKEYEQHRDRLVEILTESIALNEPLSCSL